MLEMNPNLINVDEKKIFDRHLEAEHCWMFLVDRNAWKTGENVFGSRWAYVVSKKGAQSMVNDFSDDPIALRAYLKKLSDNFRERGE